MIPHKFILGAETLHRLANWDQPQEYFVAFNELALEVVMPK